MIKCRSMSRHILTLTVISHSSQIYVFHTTFVAKAFKRLNETEIRVIRGIWRLSTQIEQNL